MQAYARVCEENTEEEKIQLPINFLVKKIIFEEW